MTAPGSGDFGTKRFIYYYQQPDNQQQDDQASVQHYPLRSHPREIYPHTVVQCLDLSVQLTDMVCLQLHHMRVYRIDYSRLQLRFPFKGFFSRISIASCTTLSPSVG